MMRYKVRVHKNARKALSKAPQRIQKKAKRLVGHLIRSGTQNPPFPIAALHGDLRRSKYLEAKIDKDYRIIFRKENGAFFIRMAGTHNELGTG